MNGKNEDGETALSPAQNSDFEKPEKEFHLILRKEDFTKIVEFLKAHGA